MGSSSSKKANVIWLDPDIDNEENTKYINRLESDGNLKVICFKEVEEGIEYTKKINFEETNIIISGKLYSQFLSMFKEYINEINVIPKFIVFTRFEEYFRNKIENKDFINNPFYISGGINTKFNNVKEFILNPLKTNIIYKNETDNKDASLEILYQKLLTLEDKDNLTFEYIDSEEKLYFPLLYQSLIDTIRTDKIELYTQSLYNNYKSNNNINKLLYPIINIKNIPIELLSKYYARLYTTESSFYKNINKDLRENKKDNYLSYIKVLYEGIKTKSFSLGSDNILYRGSRLLNKEIYRIKDYLKKKKEGLPGSIVFSKTLLSFTKDIKIAENFLRKQKNENELNKVLFILEKEKNIDYSLLTHIDIEKISFYPFEREVLFLPFSSFEIKEINEINYDNEKRYEVKLLYLGKYLEKLEKNKNDEKIIQKSEFKDQFLEFGLTEQQKIEATPKYILQKFDKFKNEINKNIIIGEITIEKENINKDIRIISSFEQYCKENIYINKDEYKNEKEIMNNIEIKINDNLIPFSYFHKFKQKGKYNIKYIFKNKIKNIGCLFASCKTMTDIDLSNYNTHYVTNIGCMFAGCKSLKKINLSNLDTKNVTYMGWMFVGCSSLQNINLSSFNIQNVIDMSYMFDGCSSLQNINLSNFNTQNVTNMNWMFHGCNSLKRKDVITTDERILNFFNG